MAHRERRELRSELQLLLTRIQAPEVAIQQTIERPKRGPVVPIPKDDDAAYREALERKMNARGN